MNAPELPSRSIASSEASSFCRKLVRDLFQANDSIKALDLKEIFTDKRRLSEFEALTEGRPERFEKSLFSETELKYLADTKFPIEESAFRLSLKHLDDLHLLTSATEAELQHFFKGLPNSELKELFYMLSDNPSFNLASPHWDLLFRRRASSEVRRRSFTEIKEVMESFYVSPRGEAKTRAEKLSSYLLLVNRAESDFDESLIPELIKLYRMSAEELTQHFEKMPLEELKKYSEVSRQFNEKYKKIYFFDIVTRDESLRPADDLGYVFSMAQKEIRTREETALLEKKALEAAEADKKEEALKAAFLENPQGIVKDTPLTLREDSFHFHDEISDQDLLLAYISFQSNGKLILLAEPVKKVFLEMAEETSEEALNTSEAKKLILKKFLEKVEKEDLNFVFGKNVAGVKKSMGVMNEVVSRYSEYPEGAKNMQRGWAWRLLADDDEIWNDPEYLQLTVRFSNAFGGGLSATSRNEYSMIKNTFMNEWKQLSPEFSPVAFTQTGSDANNLFYTVALDNVRRTLNREAKDAEILFLDGVYGGVRGKISGAGYHGMGKEVAPNLDEFKIPSPRTLSFNPTDPEEISRLEGIEADALKAIKEKFLAAKESDKPVGGFFLESIQATSDGVWFFRPVFLKQVQELCKELQIPIFADEILAGGGRSGKFWAHEHYPGFSPDYVSFGKGLQVAGVAAKRHSSINPLVTQEAQIESMLKSTMILKRVRTGNLMENARVMGQYLLNKLLKTNPPEAGVVGNPRDATRGIGMMIYPGRARTSVMNAEGRLFPYLSITKEEIDELF
ncbi:MAG: acetylornithine/succinyldiaminopimelate/putrescine aminotransferase [Bacteriovoracaceae bacterium]|jgi:acetylornithine/succinyldiaminopimelate/putrescine aminotransferase